MTPLVFCALDEFVDTSVLELFVDEDNDMHPVDQIDRSYAHGGGWHEMLGFTVVELDLDGGAFELHYEGDPTTKERARAAYRNTHLIVLFEHDWVAVIEQPLGEKPIDRAYALANAQIARLD